MEFVLVLTGLLVITAVVGVVMEGVLRRRDRLASRTTAPDSYPRCGQCGYIVHGIVHHRCPECGGNLRVVGRDWGGQ